MRSRDSDIMPGASEDELRAEIAKLRTRVAMLERMDSDAAHFVESVICMRSGHFTGDEPYVGWEGLGLALREDYDDAARWRMALEEIRMILDTEAR